MRLTFTNFPIPNRLLAVVLLALVPAFAWAGVAHAHGFRTGSNTGVAAGETFDGTLFVSGRTVDIAGTVNGDVICAGQNLTVSGTVAGDVICAGQTVSVSGTVGGDVRVAGQTVTVGGTVTGNLTAAAQSVTTEGDGRIEGDASLASTDLVLNGSVGRDVAIMSESATINGQVGRNIIGNADRLALGNNTTIGGDIDYTSNNKLSRAAGAQVTGEVRQKQPAPDSRRDDGGGFGWFALWFFMSLLLLALVLVLLFPRMLHRSAGHAMHHLGKVFLTGLAASILVPIILFGLFFTIIGIPLAILVLLVWLALLILAGPFAAYLLGRYLLRGRTDNAIWIMLSGAAVLLLIYFIPILGQLVMLVALWFGLGIILLQATRLPRPQYHVANGTDAAKDGPRH